MIRKSLILTFILTTAISYSQGIETVEELDNFRSILHIEKPQYEQLKESITSSTKQLSLLQTQIDSQNQMLQIEIYAPTTDPESIEQQLEKLQTLEKELILLKIKHYLAQKPLFTQKQLEKLKSIKIRKEPEPLQSRIREMNAGYYDRHPDPVPVYHIPPVVVHPDSHSHYRK